MKVSRFILSSFVIILLISGSFMQVHAALQLLGEGTSVHGTYNLIYDTDLDITWYDYTNSGATWDTR